MFNDKAAFNNDNNEKLRPTNITITCANEGEVAATHVGNVNIRFKNSEYNFSNLSPLIQLHNALLVPSLKYNLISVPALIKDGNSIWFSQDGSVILKDCNNLTHTIGQAIGNLYHLAPHLTYLSLLRATFLAQPADIAGVTINTSNTMRAQDTYTLWHHRLGHPGGKTLETITKYVDGIEERDVRTMTAQKLCAGYTYAKSKRRPFPNKATNQDDSILHRIYSDLCGPLPVSSVGGARYILTFIDDASRLAKIYFLKNKNDTYEKFVEFKTYVERQSGQSIKILRLDGGGEYVNAEMRRYLTKHGI